MGARERGHEEDEPNSIQLGPRRCGAGKTAAPASWVADQGIFAFAASCGRSYWGFGSARGNGNSGAVIGRAGIAAPLTARDLRSGSRKTRG